MFKSLVLSLVIPIVAGLGLNFGIVLGAMAGQIGLMTVQNGKIPGAGGIAVAEHVFLHARAIEDACSRGVSTYNLGSSGGIDAVARFKAAFGTVRVPYTEYVLEKAWMRFGQRLRGHGGGDAS